MPCSSPANICLGIRRSSWSTAGNASAACGWTPIPTSTAPAPPHVHRWEHQVDPGQGPLVPRDKVRGARPLCALSLRNQAAVRVDEFFGWDMKSDEETDGVVR